MASFSELDSYILTEVEVTGEKIGRGSYADVYQLKYMGLKCAGKKVHQFFQQEEQAENYVIRSFEKECRLLSQTQHPNIVQFLGIHFEENAKIPLLVMEYLPTNLTTCIETYDFVPKEICYSILYDIALGLNYLHVQDPQIIHRDLSSNNILLTPNMNAKISDLGVAKMLNLNQQVVMTRNPGTLVFMPPEVNTDNPEYGTSVDEFAFGVIVIHVLSRKLPQPQLGEKYFDPDSNRMIAVSELDRRKKYIDKIGADHPLMKLIIKCLCDDPHQRAHANEMVEYLAPLVSDQLNQLDVLKCIEASKRALNEEEQCIENEISEKVMKLVQDVTESQGHRKQLIEAHQLKTKELEEKCMALKEECDVLSAHKQSLTDKLQKLKGNLSATLLSLKHVQESIEILEAQVAKEFEESNEIDAGQLPANEKLHNLDQRTPEQKRPSLDVAQENSVSLEGERDSKSSPSEALNTQPTNALAKIKKRLSGKKSKSTVKFSRGNSVTNQSSEETPGDSNARRTTKVLQSLDEIEINRRHLKILDRTLTAGEFGEIRQALLKTTSVTVKILSSSHENIVHEAQLLQSFSHPNIIHLLGICTQDKPFCLITEYAKHGTLLNYLNSKDGESLQHLQLIEMAAQIASGMAHLEQASCVHRSLSAKSILVSDNVICKVSNFHYAEANNIKQSVPVTSFSVRWTAPEALTDETFSSKSDVWSFGIVLHELITQGQMPYPDMTDKEVKQKVIQEGYRMPCPKDCPDKLYDIMQSCWMKEFMDRPTFSHLQLELDNY